VELGPDCCACKPDHCDVEACPEPQCDGSSELTLPNDSCCPACVPKDACEEGDTPCSAFQCTTGYKAHVTSGPCCDHCEADPEYCATERAAYLTALEGFLDAEATACDTDADCTRLMAFNRCHAACFGPGVNKTKSSEVGQNIETYVQEHCSHCPVVNLTCAAVALMPVCREGTCE
jgi:hypothetical protein